MTKEELNRIKEHIEIHARLEPRAVYITQILWKAVTELERIAELEQENAELKTKKIPQLERKIASIRGCHSVDVKKLNARTEQVGRLKKENAELKDDNKVMADNYSKMEQKFYNNLTKAKELLKDITSSYGSTEVSEAQLYLKIKKAELFLKDSEVEK